MIELKKYCCVIRTYTLDNKMALGLTNDNVRIEQCNERGQDTCVICGSDVIEFDYFDNEKEKEARNEYIKLLKYFGSTIK